MVSGKTCRSRSEEESLVVSYMHIDNLYRDQRITLFRECYALEKVHGTSTHVTWKSGVLHFHASVVKGPRFEGLFDRPKLSEAFLAMGHEDIVVYGEGYGGSLLKQSSRYGKDVRFVAFDVKIGDCWLAVPQAHDVCNKLGIEFVHYAKVSTDIEALNAERDAPSEQARRNGVEGDKPREGVVLRPLIELTDNRGQRLIAKHKRDEERETATPRPVTDPARLQVLMDADRIAVEWVTPRRLEHVLAKLEPGRTREHTGDVIRAMIEDVVREAAGEIVDSREARGSIGRKTAEVFKLHLEKNAEPAAVE